MSQDIFTPIHYKCRNINKEYVALTGHCNNNDRCVAYFSFLFTNYIKVGYMFVYVYMRNKLTIYLRQPFSARNFLVSYVVKCSYLCCKFLCKLHACRKMFVTYNPS